MNTLTIAVLLVCATMAYASALPGGKVLENVAEAVPAAPAEELLQGEEARHYGGYGGYNNRGGGGGYWRRKHHWGK